MKTFSPTGNKCREICYGSEHESCVCYEDQLPRILPTYISELPKPQEIRVLCNPCLARLENAKEINVAPEGEGAIGNPDHPNSEID